MPALLSTALRWLFRLLLFAAAVCIGTIGAMRWIDPPTSAFMLRHQWLSEAELHHRWVDWERISPWMRLSVVASEDQRFPMHNGFDMRAIAEALEDHAEGEPLRGASTLSQQVAKNLFLSPSRSFARKGIEAALTVLIEALWPKRRILEVYLNIAQFGPHSFGVGAASQRFFGIDAADPSRYVRQRQDWILRQMQRLGGPSYLDSITGD
jgi:monofunctional biosynthetic peptidoglycan transglycosylase